jgi:hypothetical protein
MTGLQDLDEAAAALGAYQTAVAELLSLDSHRQDLLDTVNAARSVMDDITVATGYVFPPQPLEVTAVSNELAAQTASRATVTLSAADLLALDTTPVELISAPTGRQYIWPIAALIHYRYGAVPYTLPVGGSVFRVGWDTDAIYSAARTLSSSALPVFDQTSDMYIGFNLEHVSQGAISFASGLIEGAPLILYGTADDNTFPATDWMADGDGEATIRLWYSVIEGAL